MIQVATNLFPLDPVNAVPQAEATPDRVLAGGVPDHVESWDEYFLWIAEVVAIKSKDPRCSVGAVIVSSENILISTGFNGLARRIHDDERLLADAEEKLKVICHAEANAIYNAARIGVALHGASIFVTKFPCLACCNAIVQAGISRIYTHDKKFWDDDPLDGDHRHKRSVLKQSGIRIDAPFHPEYMPAQPISLKPLRKGPNRSTEKGRGAEATPERTGTA
jgi:dCMP deaminase